MKGSVLAGIGFPTEIICYAIRLTIEAVERVSARGLVAAMSIQSLRSRTSKTPRAARRANIFDDLHSLATASSDALHSIAKGL